MKLITSSQLLEAQKTQEDSRQSGAYVPLSVVLSRSGLVSLETLLQALGKPFVTPLDALDLVQVHEETSEPRKHDLEQVDVAEYGVRSLLSVVLETAIKLKATKIKLESYANKCTVKFLVDESWHDGECVPEAVLISMIRYLETVCERTQAQNEGVGRCSFTLDYCGQLADVSIQIDRSDEMTPIAIDLLYS